MRSWLDEIRAAAPTVVIVLVGNKCTTMNAQRRKVDWRVSHACFMGELDALDALNGSM